jgi:hypothetical protein
LRLVSLRQIESFAKSGGPTGILLEAITRNRVRFRLRSVPAWQSDHSYLARKHHLRAMDRADQ